ncbi:hypothetical protein [Autumnicola musiva]|uniref:DUF3298 domain-containing protein n=1 Tax=Autumnicola musiva TaxID=3075589 RepID=A0ABU3D8W6_9FLAO|nr:hypothetical protein [Zunongwangia sp. F117]MDT0677968.1 hypothetical protein [Zunongwangia sp. F117]
MKNNYINIKGKRPFSYLLACLLVVGLLGVSCSSDDDLEDIEEETARQDAEISFDPEYFGQSFSTAPDSTHQFTVNINKGQKVATGFSVYEKIISEGVVVQERTELPEYRRDLSGEESETIQFEYHVAEDRQDKDKITLDFVLEQEEDEVSEAMVLEVEKEVPEEDPIQEINDIIYYTQLALGGQDNAETGSFFNIEEATNYTLPEASSNQESIDLAMLVGASTGINFLAPASSGFQYFGSEISDAVYDGWDIKNEGEFVNIGNLEDAEATFEGLEYAADIISAYEQAQANVTNIPGYVENENGPGDRVRRVNVGDIIFFKTEGGAIAVLKITSILPDTAGMVEFEMKTAADPDAEPVDPGEDEDEDNEEGELAHFSDIEVGGQDNTSVGSYFNISNQTVYTLDDATAVQAEINFIMLLGASTGVNFLAPASSGLQYFGSDIETAVYEGWETKNDGQFVNIGNADTAALFDGLSSEEELNEAYQSALAEVEQMDGYVENENGPGDRIRQVKQDDVIFFEAEDGTLIVFKVNQLATETSGSVIFEMKTAN